MALQAITKAQARGFLLGHLGLRQRRAGPPVDAVRGLLTQLRCIQLDPLDVIGTNSDLVAMARVDGLRRGELFRHLLPGHAFEHFAKERCLLPASAYPYYRERMAQTPGYRTTAQQRRLSEALIADVLAEVQARGPLTPRQLNDRGAVDPIDWSGWKSTSRAASMAIELLSTRGHVVVAGRSSAGKLYDIPERVLATASEPAEGDYATWALMNRVEACGLLARATGPCWSMLRDIRISGLADQLIAEGRLEEVTVVGSRRPYLAPAGFLDRVYPDDDGLMRILGPLDPLIWDRKLVQNIFDFEYIWEVYKPAAKRRWGWYVCPLLHDGRLVGRIEPAVTDGVLTLKNRWDERPGSVDDAALATTLQRQQAAL